MRHTTTLTLRCPKEALEALTPLAREGLGVDIRPGLSLRGTLERDLGFCPTCVEERIQTVFLDGSPVDDIDRDAAAPGCTLALAAAMPGIAGIAMRRGSPVGVFREGVTHQPAGQPVTQPAGQPVAHPINGKTAQQDEGPRLRITLKLFNLVAVECLAWVLEQGAEVPALRLAEVLEEREKAFAEATLALDGRALSLREATAALRKSGGQIRLEALL